MDSTLDTVDREIRQEQFNSERSMKVLDRICRNDPRLLTAIWPYAIAALLDARIAAIEPPKKKPGPAKKKGRSSR